MAIARMVLLGLGLAGVLFSQTMVEAAAAAAGGSVAGMAGKKLSDGVDKVLGKASQQGEKVSQPQPAAARKQPAPAAVAPPSRIPASRTARAGAARKSPPVAPALPSASEPTEPAAASAPPAETPAPSPEDLAKIGVGTTREEVLSRLGQPASKMTLAEDGQLLETYYFRAKGGALSKVRLTNGVVSSVDVPASD